MAKRFYLTLLGWHLAIIVFHHAGSAMMVLRETGTCYRVGLVGIGGLFEAVQSWPPVRYYAHYTGTAIGSGYFAPQVGSHFLVSLTDLDQSANKLATTYHAPFRTRTGQLRFFSCCQLFQGFLNRNKPGGHTYEKQMAHHIGSRLVPNLSDEQAEYRAVCVQAYRPPTLAEARRNQPASLLAIYRTQWCICKTLSPTHEHFLLPKQP